MIPPRKKPTEASIKMATPFFYVGETKPRIVQSHAPTWDEVPISAKKTLLGSFFRLLTNLIPKESLSKLHKHAICCKTNGWNMGSLREVSSALQARRREHAGDRATNFGENVSFRCSRAPTTTCGGPPPSRREARATSSLYILLNATQRCHFVISLKNDPIPGRFPFYRTEKIALTAEMHTKAMAEPPRSCPALCSFVFTLEANTNTAKAAPTKAGIHK